METLKPKKIYFGYLPSRYDYTWCHKFKESDIGTWSDADYCTNDSRTTPFGEKCIDR